MCPDMFGDFYFVKSDKIANNSEITNAGEKISTDVKSLEFQTFLMQVGWVKYENKQTLFDKFSHRHLVTTKLFTG